MNCANVPVVELHSEALNTMVHKADRAAELCAKSGDTLQQCAGRGLESQHRLGIPANNIDQFVRRRV